MNEPVTSTPTRERLVHGVVVHYHEIGLKGRNRGFFERRLVDNLRAAVRGAGDVRVEVLNGRLFVRTADTPSETVLDAVGRTFGIAFFAPCVVVASDLKEIVDAALTQLSTRSFETFAVAAKRSSKEFALTSREINVQVGAAVQAATGAGVDLGSPDATVWIEVVGKRTFVYVERRDGPGGLPVGSSGKVVALLSGGIDSPVATLRILKRGAKAVLVHFHSAPFTDRSSLRKAAELAKTIAQRQGDTTLYLVAIGHAQQQIVGAAPAALRVILYRRLMMRIAAEVARREGAKALVTGDSLGQVASQTLENIACVDDVATLPVLRPLVGEAKQEIVSDARRLGTYETSILPFEDCCSLFVPKSPATRASVDECRAAEAALDSDALATSCLREAEVQRIAGWREPGQGHAGPEGSGPQSVPGVG
jgi:thiamine biosynthesis protein ThiI